MRRLLETWRSWSVRRRLLTAGGLVVVVAAAAIGGYLLVRRPADKTCAPNCPKLHTKQEKKPKKSGPRLVNWPMYGYDDARTRYLDTQHVHPPFQGSSWSFQAGQLLEFSPIVVNGTLYIIDKTGLLFALNAKTGHVEWKKDIATLNASSPAYSHNRLFAATLDPGQVVAMNPSKNGHIVWKHPLPGRTESSPVVWHNRVIVGCECGNVYALNPKNGDTEWTVSTGSPVKGAVAIDGNTAFFGNYGGQLWAVNANDGHTKWTAQTEGGGFLRGGGIYATPAVAYGRVYIGSLDGRVYSYAEKTGQLVWSHSTGAEVYSGAAVADTPHSPPTVYVGSADKHFYALNAATGQERWDHYVGGIVLGAPSVIGETVYMAVIGPNIGTFGFRVGDGKQVFQNDIGEYNPVISDGRDLYLTGESEIRAFSPVPPHHKHSANKHGGASGHRRPKGHHRKKS